MHGLLLKSPQIYPHFSTACFQASLLGANRCLYTTVHQADMFPFVSFCAPQRKIGNQHILQYVLSWEWKTVDDENNYTVR